MADDLRRYSYQLPVVLFPVPNSLDVPLLIACSPLRGFGLDRLQHER